MFIMNAAAAEIEWILKQTEMTGMFKDVKEHKDLKFPTLSWTLWATAYMEFKNKLHLRNIYSKSFQSGEEMWKVPDKHNDGAVLSKKYQTCLF